MRVLILLMLFFVFNLCQGQSVYELNKEALKHCRTCKPKKKILNPNQDSIKVDLKIYREMINPIAVLKPNISEYLTVYPSLLSKKSITVELVDGLKLISHDFYGGYTAFNLKLLVYNDLIIYSRLNIEVENNVFETIYLNKISIPLSCSGRDMEYYKIHEKNLEEYKKTYPNFSIEIDLDKYSTTELNVYYNLNEVTYNYAAYHVGKEYTYLAEGFIKILLEQKKYKVFEKLLFGVNPVARIYSYSVLNIAISNGYKPSIKIVRQMEKVKQDGLKFKSSFNSLDKQVKDFDFTNKLSFD